MRRALILGGGFTGSRVAALLRARGWHVLCTNRSGTAGLRLDLDDEESVASLQRHITPESIVLHSIPSPGVVPALMNTSPSRVVYLSTTGVYGSATVVDETTLPAPRTERELLRVAEETAVLAGPWSALVLRPAAIYGPGRGIHASMRAGTYLLNGNGSNYVSRIHVDDLARLAVAALTSGVTGAYPVADEEPCTSHEIAAYCAGLLGVAMPVAALASALGETRRADRRVNGSAIRKLLGVELEYPNYRAGIAACLATEARALS